MTSIDAADALAADDAAYYEMRWHVAQRDLDQLRAACAELLYLTHIPSREILVMLLQELRKEREWQPTTTASTSTN